MMSQAKLVVGLVGNPNCGKTTLFNALTGSRQQVGNWPGVTVEKKTGQFIHQQTKIDVVDLPGTYSLDFFTDSTSLDEQVAQQYILSNEADLIINIIDASNLERNLYLTTQLLEMRVPMLIVLNMMDMAKANGIEINIEHLQQKLQCPIIPITASKQQGIKELKTFLSTTTHFQKPTLHFDYPATIEKAIADLKDTFSPSLAPHINPDWLALKLIEGNQLAIDLVEMDSVDATIRICEHIESELDEEVDIIMADIRYSFINYLIKDTVKRKDRLSRTVSDKIDRFVLNRIIGIPFFLAVMYLMFILSINLGGAFTDFFDGLFGTIFVDGLGHLMTQLHSPEWLKILIADGIGGGIQTVSTFIPVITFLFLFLSILEDSGYMARAAFVMDRFMRFIGLPGKSFVPLIVGFGCNVPAVMATRTLESEKDRLMTMAMAPFMSCGARLPVYALFAIVFFPVGGQNIVFLLYILGIVAAILTGLVLKNTLLPGKTTPFIMELPPYHLPNVKGIIIHIWGRLKSFMFRAGKVIVPMVMILNTLNAIHIGNQTDQHESGQSVLAIIGKTITPAFAPMGISEQNWPAAVGIFTGVLAKEAVVGTLNALYADVAGAADNEDEAFNFTQGIKDAFATIPENLHKLVSDKLLDPLGMGIENADEAKEVPNTVLGVMKQLFPDKASAFAYLLLILLYFPCVAVIGAITREASLQWAVFIALWSTGFGYSVAVIFYQLATFTLHPLYSSCWIIGLALFIIFGLTMIKQYASSRLKAFRTEENMK